MIIGNQKTKWVSKLQVNFKDVKKFKNTEFSENESVVRINSKSNFRVIYLSDGMDYVLMDIKNYLKKLENGQNEIEAGQWELHKDIANINKAICDLKNLKGAFKDIKIKSSKQMELIKELQFWLQKINKKREEVQPLTVSESSMEYEGVYKRSADTNDFSGRNIGERCEEIIEITPRRSSEKDESDADTSASTNEQYQGNEDRVERQSCRKSFKKQPNVVQNAPNCGYYSTRTTTNDILQRYLKDSAKYMGQNRSTSSEKTYCSSPSSETEKPSEKGEYVSFWDEICSRTQAQPESQREMWKPSVRESSSGRTVESTIPRRYCCTKCPKEFVYEVDLLRHKNRHRMLMVCGTCGKGFGSKAGLREYEVAQGMPSRSGKGFRCCYCTKIYSSPKKLTAHLRRCRIISKYQPTREH